MDPKAVIGVNPYEVFGNNPIKRIDPNGDISYEATISTTKENGKTIKTIKATVTFGVINIASEEFGKSRVGGQRINAKPFSGTATEVVNGETIEYRFETEIKYNYINSVDELGEFDNIITIVDDIKPWKEGGNDPIAQSSPDGNFINVEFYNRYYYVLWHEMGHTYGFIYPDNPDDVRHSKDNPFHLMYVPSFGSKSIDTYPSDLMRMYRQVKDKPDGTHRHKSLFYIHPRDVLNKNESYDEDKAKKAGFNIESRVQNFENR